MPACGGAFYLGNRAADWGSEIRNPNSVDGGKAPCQNSQEPESTTDRAQRARLQGVLIGGENPVLSIYRTDPLPDPLPSLHWMKAMAYSHYMSSRNQKTSTAENISHSPKQKQNFSSVPGALSPQEIESLRQDLKDTVKRERELWQQQHPASNKKSEEQIVAELAKLIRMPKLSFDGRLYYYPNDAKHAGQLLAQGAQPVYYWREQKEKSATSTKSK